MIGYPDLRCRPQTGGTDPSSKAFERGAIFCKYEGCSVGCEAYYTKKIWSTTLPSHKKPPNYFSENYFLDFLNTKIAC
jgi:hypothetical protein